MTSITWNCMGRWIYGSASAATPTELIVVDAVPAVALDITYDTNRRGCGQRATSSILNASMANLLGSATGAAVSGLIGSDIGRESCNTNEYRLPSVRQGLGASIWEEGSRSDADAATLYATNHFRVIAGYHLEVQKRVYDLGFYVGDNIDGRRSLQTAKAAAKVISPSRFPSPISSRPSRGFVPEGLAD